MRARAVDTTTLPPETVTASIVHIAENLRPADAAELLASVGERPAADVLLESWRMSTSCWLILDRTGLPIGVFGVAPGPAPGIGIVWLMGTEGIEREFVAVARQTRGFVYEMHAEYKTLWNFIDARNELSLRWLLWAGFHVIGVDPFHGPEERTFLEFARIE